MSSVIVKSLAVSIVFLLCWVTVEAVLPQEQPKQLTEVQQLKAELLKTKMQLAVKEQQLATCTLQVLQQPAATMEQEFLKQVGAAPDSTWDWSSMSAKPKVK